MVKLLLRRGASTSLVGPFGATALHFACEQGMDKPAITLVQAGCPSQIKDEDGLTAEKVAEANSSEDFVAALRNAMNSYAKKQNQSAAAKMKPSRAGRRPQHKKPVTCSKCLAQFISSYKGKSPRCRRCLKDTKGEK